MNEASYPSTDIHPADLKAKIQKRGGTITSLARASGVSVGLLAMAMKARTSERAERIIADFLGEDPASLWPSRYPGGRRLKLKMHVDRDVAPRCAA